MINKQHSHCDASPTKLQRSRGAKQSRKLFFTLFCATQISINIGGMENEPLALLPEIQGKIVTTILDLYLDELEYIIKEYTKDFFWHNKHDKNSSLYKMLYWINGTRFKPLQEHINLNTTSNKGNTLLHHTIWASIECTEINSIADYEYEDHLSHCNGNVDMVNFTRYLLTHKANPNMHNNDGKSPFFVWINYGFFHSYSVPMRPVESTVINLLLDHGADPNVASKDNSFIFILATARYSPEIERILKKIDLKAVTYGQNENGVTITVQAIYSHNLEFLQALADAGAYFYSTDRHLLNFALRDKENHIQMHGTEHFEKMITLLKNNTTNT